MTLLSAPARDNLPQRAVARNLSGLGRVLEQKVPELLLAAPVYCIGTMNGTASEHDLSGRFKLPYARGSAPTAVVAGRAGSQPSRWLHVSH